MSMLRPLTLARRKSKSPFLIPKPAPIVYLWEKLTTAFAPPDQVPPSCQCSWTSFSSRARTSSFASLMSRPEKSGLWSLSVVNCTDEVIAPK